MRRFSTTVYIDNEQHKALVWLSKETSIPMAVLVRRGIDLAIKEQEHKLNLVSAARERERLKIGRG